MKNYTVSFGSGDPRGFTGLNPTFLSFINLATGTTNAPPSITETIVGKTGIYTFAYGVTQPISFLIDAATTSPGASARYVIGQIDPFDRADEYGNTLTAIGFSNLVYGSSLFAQGQTLTAIGFSNLVYGSSLFAQGQTLLSVGFSNLSFGTSLMAQGSTLFGIGTTTLAKLVNEGITLTAIGTTQFAFGTTLVFLGSSGGVFSLMGSPSSGFGSTSIDPTDLFGYLKRAQEISEGNQIYTKVSGLLDYYNRGSTTLLREKTISDTVSQTTKS